MKRVLFILWLLLAAGALTRGQTILGKHPADKVLPGFFNQNGNADATMDGLNAHATHGLSGTLITDGTINSNKLDDATRAMLGGNGGGVAGNVFLTQVGGTGLVLTTNLLGFYYTLMLNAALQGYAALPLNSLTNSLNAYAQAQATAATNNYPWGSLYDPANAAAAVQTFASGASNSVLNQATNGPKLWSPTLYRTTSATNFQMNTWGLTLDSFDTGESLVPALVVNNPTQVGIGALFWVQTDALFDQGIQVNIGMAGPGALVVDASGNLTALSLNGPGGGITGLNASSLASGTVAAARLGTGGTGGGTKFLADDQTFKTITSGGGDVFLAAQNNFTGTSNTFTGPLYTPLIVASEIDTATFVVTAFTSLGLLTNSGTIITNPAAYVFQGSNGLNVASNVVNTTYRWESTNHTTRWGSNGVDTVTINPISGNVAAASFTGGGWPLTNLNTFDSLVPTFTGTAFWLGTNSAIITSSNIYIMSLANLPPTGMERYGQLTIRATADITITNLPLGTAGNPGTSDMATSRTCTNGNTVVISVDVIPTVSTNFAIVQFH